MLSGLLDLAITFVLLLAMLLYYGLAPSGHVATLPFFVLLTVLLAAGVSLWLSALNALYRDVGFIVPFLLQVWMYATPVIYPASLVPERWQWLLYLNPMTALIEGIRWSILGTEPPNPAGLVASIAIMAIILFGGVAVFRRIEGIVADRI